MLNRHKEIWGSGVVSTLLIYFGITKPCIGATVVRIELASAELENNSSEAAVSQYMFLVIVDSSQFLF
ncbi:hypothetical protein JCM19238_3458 [Vibrio ponticus]|nr:hypothetical protein JCM19238_3458 [Vibrio ponticus]